MYFGLILCLTWEDISTVLYYLCTFRIALIEVSYFQSAFAYNPSFTALHLLL